jgi:hypothetical protein
MQLLCRLQKFRVWTDDWSIKVGHEEYIWAVICWSQLLPVSVTIVMCILWTKLGRDTCLDVVQFRCWNVSVADIWCFRLRRPPPRQGWNWTAWDSRRADRSVSPVCAPTSLLVIRPSVAAAIPTSLAYGSVATVRLSLLILAVSLFPSKATDARCLKRFLIEGKLSDDWKARPTDLVVILNCGYETKYIEYLDLLFPW